MRLLANIFANRNDHGTNINNAVYSSTIEYYENLIQKEQTKAFAYKLPTDAREYGNRRTLSRKAIEYGTYDFIVIGAGSAGAVVANRLSELHNMSTLLLEAGEYENNFTDIPGMMFMTRGSKYNWGYTTIPQRESCFGMIDHKCLYPRGKGIGGTSIITGLVYSRGSKHDYNLWGAENPGWSYKDVLPYFKNSENSQLPHTDNGYHSTGGNYNVEYTKFQSDHLKAFLAANVEVGHKIIDYNGQTEIGASQAQLNTINGRRMSTGKAFINPAKNRKNLHISLSSYVTKILIDPKTKITQAVKFVKNNVVYIARVRNEVILSAGAIASPQILQLSGVGPSALLNKHRITVIKNLPVGQAFQDQPAYFGLNIGTNISIPLKPIDGYIKDYLKGDGIWNLPGSNAGVSFYKSRISKILAPDYEIMFNTPNRTGAFTQKGQAFTDVTTKALFGNVDNPKTFTMNIGVLHPLSRGTVRIKSGNPFDYPEIDAGLFESRYDKEIMYEAIMKALELIKTKAFKRIDAQLGKVVLPGCMHLDYLSKSFWMCMMKYLGSVFHHPVGSCNMASDPKDGVVDNKLKVHGIHGLRVADASIIPFTLSGHTNAPAIMVGERVADFVKQDL